MGILIKGMDEIPEDGAVLVVKHDNGKAYIKHACTYGYSMELVKLPAVQPVHVADISKKVEGDCISRQALIDALHTWFRDGFNEDKWWNSTHVLAAIEGMSPAQQGYKWETCFECPLSHGCPKIKGCTNGQAIEYASQIPNDCPLSAQPEQNAYEQGRITGRVEMRTEILSALKEMVGSEVWLNV